MPLAIPFLSAFRRDSAKLPKDGVRLVLEREFSSFRNADSARFGTRVKWSLGSGFWRVVFGKWFLGSGFWEVVSGDWFLRSVFFWGGGEGLSLTQRHPKEARP